ncbi:MAG: glycerophosphodiester phosphodiesterase, partial [Candidatus Bathyarchaeia archaeon]
MLLIGHRGAKAYEPENTLRSFQKALEMGANAVELDVRKTKDDQLVVIHDADV